MLAYVLGINFGVLGLFLSVSNRAKSSSAAELDFDFSLVRFGGPNFGSMASILRSLAFHFEVPGYTLGINFGWIGMIDWIGLSGWLGLSGYLLFFEI